MSDNIRYLPPPIVTARICPGCGFGVTQIGASHLSYNFMCPRCGEHKISEFLPNRMNRIKE